MHAFGDYREFLKPIMCPSVLYYLRFNLPHSSATEQEMKRPCSVVLLKFLFQQVDSSLSKNQALRS